MQVGHIEVGDVMSQVAAESEWDERLMPIGEPIRNVGKEELRNVVAGGGALPGMSSRLAIRVGRANGYVMTSCCETMSQGPHYAWDAPISPGVFTVRRNVQDAKTHELQSYTSADIERAAVWLEKP